MAKTSFNSSELKNATRGSALRWAAREAFRQVNYVSPAVKATIAGLGAYGYELALMAAKTLTGK